MAEVVKGEGLLLAGPGAAVVAEVVGVVGEGTMRVVCAWCGLALGVKPCAWGQDGQVSHGICPACKASLLARYHGEHQGAK